MDRNILNRPGPEDDGGDDDDSGPGEDDDDSDPGDTDGRDSKASDKDAGDDDQAPTGSDDKDTTPGSSTTDDDDDPKDGDDNGSPAASTYLPAGYKPGVWYEKVDGEFISTGATDSRELGQGDFYMVSEDGVQYVHLDDSDSSVDPTAPEMTGYQSYHQQDQADVGKFSGTPIPGTTVYVYDSASTLPGFLASPTPNDPKAAWVVDANGFRYQVYPDPLDDGAQVWRAPGPRHGGAGPARRE